MDARITVKVLGVSETDLTEMMTQLHFMDERISVERIHKRSLAADPATVALIGAGGVLIAQLISSAVNVYLEHKKRAAEARARHEAESQKPVPAPTVMVTVNLVLGGKLTKTIGTPADVNGLVSELPADSAEVTSVTMS